MIWANVDFPDPGGPTRIVRRAAAATIKAFCFAFDFPSTAKIESAIGKSSSIVRAIDAVAIFTVIVLPGHLQPQVNIADFTLA